MTTKVQKWGNSLAVRLPKEAVRKFDLGEGSPVVVVASGSSISIKPVKPETYSLKEMLSRVTKNNRHELVDWGKPVGKEIW